MERPTVSARGVYYDLNESPYEFKSPYGDIFKFPSAKKLEIYTRDIEKELNRVEAIIERHGLGDFITENTHDMLKRAMYRAFYRKVRG